MKQIGNWVFGSFFRTIGRLLVFVLIGFIIARFVDFGAIKDNFDITHLLGIEKIDALTYTVDLKQVGDAWIDESNINNDWSYTSYGYMQRFSSTTTTSTRDLDMTFDSPINTTTVDFVSFPLTVTQPTRNLQQNNEVANVWCDTWYGITDSAGHQQFTCQNWNTEYTTNYQPYQQQLTTLNFYFNVVYVDDNGNWAGWNSCDIENGNILCPTNRRKIKYLQIHVNFITPDTTYSTIYIGGGIRFFNYNDARTAIEEQTQQQQQQHNETMSYLEDTNSTSTENSANNFFGNFSTTDSGGLSSIITAPLVMVNKMLDGQCVMPSATWKGATISLPCGDLLWSRPGASDLKNLLNVFYGGFICYYAIRKLFLMIEGMKDPTSDRIEVSDL